MALSVREQNKQRDAWIRRVVTQAADRWPKPTGAQKVKPSRLGFLRKQRVVADVGYPNVTRSRLWLVPGDEKQVLLEVARDAAPGWGMGRKYAALTWLGIDSRYGYPPVPHRYLGPGPDHGDVHHQPRGYFSASVQAKQLGDLVAVRVDVTGTRVPARPDSSYLRHVTRVDFRQYRDFRGHHLVKARRVHGRDLHRLTRGFNRMPGWTGVAHSCPWARWPHYVLIFHAAEGRVRADSTNSCLALWKVSTRGRQRGPLLSAPGDLYPLVRRLGVVTPQT